MELTYFNPKDFVPDTIYQDRKEKSYQLINKDLLIFIDHLRSALNAPVLVNRAGMQYRGLRTPECAEYSKYSQHTYGNAIDFDVQGMSADSVRKWIIEHRNLWWVAPITFIEDGTNWVHVDARATTYHEKSNTWDLWLWDSKTGATSIYQRGE